MRHYEVAGTGLALTGLSFIIAALSSLLLQSLSIAGLVIDLVGVLLVLAEWIHLRQVERRYTALAVFVFLIALIASLLGRSLALILSHSALNVASGAVSAVQLSVSDLLFYLSFFIYIYPFAGEEAKGMLIISFAGGVLYSLILLPLLSLGAGNYIGLPYYAHIFLQVVTVLFGLTYLVTGIAVTRR